MANSPVLQFLVPVFSNRWGYDDFYTLTLAQVYLELRWGGEVALCRWTTGGPVWQSNPHSLERVLGHDYIDFPIEFKRDLKLIWTRWRASSFDDEKAEYEMQRLFYWLNAVTKAEKERQERIEAGEEDEGE